MAEVFRRASTTLAGVFSADLGRLSLGAGISVALIQNINATFMQNVTRLYEVGSNFASPGGINSSNVYYVGGRSQGTCAIARVIGPSTLLSAYYAKFGDVCQAATNNMQLTFDNGVCFPGNGRFSTYTLRYCVITQIGISVAAQDMVVNENSQLMFSGLDYAGD
jgi:hypothetical protein